MKCLCKSIQTTDKPKPKLIFDCLIDQLSLWKRPGWNKRTKKPSCVTINKTHTIMLCILDADRKLNAEKIYNINISEYSAECVHFSMNIETGKYFH